MNTKSQWRMAWRLMRVNKGMILCSEAWITDSVMAPKAAWALIKRELGDSLPRTRYVRSPF